MSYDPLAYDWSQHDVTLYTYLPNGQLLGEVVVQHDDTVLEQRDLVWRDNVPVAMHATIFGANEVVQDQQTYMLHADHLNSPRRATNSSATKVWTWYHHYTHPVSGRGGIGLYGGGPISPINLRFPVTRKMGSDPI